MTALASPAPSTLPMLGVLGGGQLGRMFVHAAQTLGYRTAVLDPDAQSPAGLVSHLHLCVPYLDAAGLHTLASACLAVTIEFENVPADALQQLAARVPVAPGADALFICQDRALEKAHFLRSGVACAPWARIESDADIARADTGLLSGPLSGLFPGLLKTARLGYDGKGQATVLSPADLPAAWAQLGGVPCVLEARLPLLREFSVLVARGFDGQVVHLPPQQNLHRNGILAVTQVPAPDIDVATASAAISAAETLATSMAYVGVLCVEFFLLTDGRLVANEMAPRPHNSGHYSIDACDVSQFDLQVRTMARLPLVAPRQHSFAVMLNLLGDLWSAGNSPSSSPRSASGSAPDWLPVLALPGAHLHLYGKAEARAGRKMGHLTFTAASADAARTVALRAVALLGLEPF